MNPTFVIPPSFLGCEIFHQNRNNSAYSIVGIPYDMGTSNRPGTRFGPAAIRAASRMLTCGEHPLYFVDPRKNLDIVDAGDLEIIQGDVSATINSIQKQLIRRFDHMIALGGDHSISLPILREMYRRFGPVALVHFDAHIDTWEDNYGSSQLGHGNPFYHAITEGLIDTSRMFQIGIRSPMNKSVYDWTIEKGSRIYSAMDIHKCISLYHGICDNINRVIGNHPTYLTIDIDVLDPAFAPGTGTPEIGGLTSWQVLDMMQGIRYLNFVGMDVVEVSPPYDVSEITSLAAATFVWEYLSMLASRF